MVQSCRTPEQDKCLQDLFKFLDVNEDKRLHRAELNRGLRSLSLVSVLLGQNTNANREISGFSSLIDSNIVLWNGGPSQLPFFSEEECTIELTIENEVDTLRDTITIVSSKTYENGIWFENF